MGAKWSARSAGSATSFPSTVTGKGATSSSKVRPTRNSTSAAARSGGAIMRMLPWTLLIALGLATGTAAAQEKTIKVGIARSTSNAAELMALKHGYFKDAGIKLQWDDIDSTANVIALLAQNQYQIV